MQPIEKLRREIINNNFLFSHQQQSHQKKRIFLFLINKMHFRLLMTSNIEQQNLI